MELRQEAQRQLTLYHLDNWNEKIAWVNPESLFEGNNDFTENETERFKRDVVGIAISKIEEFASILDDTVDTTA